MRTDKGRVKARHVILAGNGYLPNIVPKVSAKIMPLNSFIAATEPLGDRAAEILARDIAVVDMRNENRPTLRMSGKAVEELRRAKGLVAGAGAE